MCLYHLYWGKFIVPDVDAPVFLPEETKNRVEVHHLLLPLLLPQVVLQIQYISMGKCSSDKVNNYTWANAVLTR